MRIRRLPLVFAAALALLAAFGQPPAAVWAAEETSPAPVSEPSADSAPGSSQPDGDAAVTPKTSFGTTPAATPPVSAAPATGSLSYRARVVHNNRAALSIVSGRVDLASGDLEELVDQSWLLDWQRIPAGMTATRPILPAIWQSAGRPALQLGRAMPRYDSPLLRHFIVGQLIANPQSIVPGAQFLSDQLLIDSADIRAGSFEIVGRFRGSALVLVGNSVVVGGHSVPASLTVLGSSGELYHYFFDEQQWSWSSGSALIALPGFDASRYVKFPSGEPHSVAIRPVKDWLVFQAQLPNGRPLNLVLDSGADTMIIDDLVLRLDANLEPSGAMDVEGALAGGRMQVYDNFSFNVGGVEFRDLPVLGAPMTSLGIGAELRIHGIVGAEILELCRLDVNLDRGELKLFPPGSTGNEAGQQVPLTFIQELPHIEATVQNTGKALFLLDTGQRSALSINMDYLQSHKLDDALVMNGFLGDVTGGLLPRYMLENMNVSLAGQTYSEKTVDAAPDSTFTYAGQPVAGSIGFSMLARHFGGITIDYSKKLLLLRDPAQTREFTGNLAAWDSLDAQPRNYALNRAPADEPAQRASAPSERRAEAAERGSTEAASAPAEEAASALRPVLQFYSGTQPVGAAGWGAEVDTTPNAGLRKRYDWAGNKGNLSDPLSLVNGKNGDEIRMQLDAGLLPQGESAASDDGPGPSTVSGRRSAFRQKLRDLAQAIFGKLLLEQKKARRKR